MSDIDLTQLHASLYMKKDKSKTGRQATRKIKVQNTMDKKSFQKSKLYLIVWDCTDNRLNSILLEYFYYLKDGLYMFRPCGRTKKYYRDLNCQSKFNTSRIRDLKKTDKFHTNNYELWINSNKIWEQIIQIPHIIAWRDIKMKNKAFPIIYGTGYEKRKGERVDKRFTKNAYNLKRIWAQSSGVIFDYLYKNNFELLSLDSVEDYKKIFKLLDCSYKKNYVSHLTLFAFNILLKYGYRIEGIPLGRFLTRPYYFKNFDNFIGELSKIKL